MKSDHKLDPLRSSAGPPVRPGRMGVRKTQGGEATILPSPYVQGTSRAAWREVAVGWTCLSRSEMGQAWLLARPGLDVHPRQDVSDWEDWPYS